MPPKDMKTDRYSGNKTDYKQGGAGEGWSITQKALGVGAVGAIVAVGLWLSKK